ncbi:hypothetical protein [Vulcanisaeta thermophila]|uniref:hypothetical protein n=1 Tax=Vulcanisaeta thermophila TaxID=867917 RepID=UPI000853C6CC|nr:hypothetical protein [Vulcanisaeta thermophila]
MASLRERSGGGAFELVNKFLAEVWRGFRVSLSRPTSIIINILTSPLWLAFFILTLRGYGVVRIGAFELQLFLWSAYAFALYSSWLWGFGHGIINEGYEGILEYLISSGQGVFLHALGFGVSYSIYTLFDLAALILSFYLIFGLTVTVKYPLILALSIVLAMIQLLMISLIYVLLVIKLRSSWVITDIMQFVMPILGGLIPSEASGYFRDVNMYSPIAYPFILMRESALGVMEIPIPLWLQLTYSLITVVSLSVITYLLSGLFVRRMRVEGRLGLT